MPRSRVLVVDDSEEVREFFQVVLDQAGYQVDTAESGEDALAKVKRERPDLILLDVVMPGMDGLQLLLKLRSDLAPPVPPVILCSGFDLTGEEALRRGAARFLPKPVDARDLIAAVGDALAGRRAAGDSIARARERAGAARQRARETAARLLRELEAQAPPGQPFSQHATALVSFVARYLAVDVVLAAVLREDRLLVLASSDASRIAPDLDLGEALPAAEKVLESGSSLVLPDVATQTCVPWPVHRLDEVGCLIAVPIRFEERAIGVLCVVHSCATPIAGEDLALVQLLSSRGTSLLQAWVAGRLYEELPFRLGPGVAPRRPFEKMLDLELRLLHARGGSLELAIAGVTNLGQVYHSVALAADPSRLLAGLLSDGRVALYKRDADGEARTKLAAVLADLRERGGMRSAGVVDLTADALSAFGAQDLLRLAEQALDAALESSSPVRRLVVDAENA